MIQNDGGNTSNTSELESSQERYVPYSERHAMSNERLWLFLNYLERVIWVDVELSRVEYVEWTNESEVMIYLPNGKILSINPRWVVFAEKFIWNEPENAFFAMEAPAFFHTYQSIIPAIKHEFIS